MTKKAILDDIILQLTQSNPSDDLALEYTQLAQWLDYYRNLVVTTELNSKLEINEMIPSIYLTREACLVSEAEENDCGDDCENRISIELENDVMTLNNDGGIVMVQTDDGDQVIKAGAINTIMLFRNMRYAKPSEENFVYYRQGTKIYIEGMKAVDIPFDNFHVWYVAKQDLGSAIDSTEVIASDLALPQIIAAVVQAGKQQMYGTQVDNESDGVDNKQVQYHTAISNPQNNQ
jgi:hypothetical protein